MSADFERLERELASLRPREPSAELERKVNRLLDWSPWRVFWPIFFGVLTGMFLLLWFFADGPPRQTTQLAPPPAPSAATPVSEESQPTLQAYRRAIDHSPEELDALLGKQAVLAGGESTSFHAFSRSELVSLGEP